MKTETKLRMEMMGRAVRFEGTHGIAAPGSYLEGRFAELETVEQKLRVAAGRQEAAQRGFREHAARRGAASAALQEWMADLARVARSLPLERYGGIAERFRMPRSQSYVAQRASATAFIEALRELQEVFAPRGFDEESIGQAEALIAQVETANGAKVSRFSARIEQTAELMLLSRHGLAIVREIDAILQRALRANASLLAEWNSISRVHRPWKKAAAQPAPQAAATVAITESSQAIAPADGSPEPGAEAGHPPGDTAARSHGSEVSGAP